MYDCKSVRVLVCTIVKEHNGGHHPGIDDVSMETGLHVPRTQEFPLCTRACPVNTYYKNFTSGEGTCTTCPLNSYTSEQASTLCTCLQGFTPRYNSSLHHPGGACVACISGFYKPKPGDDLCTACPPGSYASPPAASNVSQCAVCPPGMLQLVGHGSGNSGIHT